MRNVIAELKKLPQPYEQFDEDTWYALVNYVTVYSKDDILIFYTNCQILSRSGSYFFAWKTKLRTNV